MRVTGTVRWLHDIFDLLVLMVFRPRHAPPPPTTTAHATVAPLMVLAAINAERTRHFRSPLEPDLSLDQFAADWVGRMIALGRCTHGDPGTADDFDERFAVWHAAGDHGDELVACGPITATEVIGHWTRDPRTKGVLLGARHKRLGVACDSNAYGLLFWSCVFSD